MKLIQWHVVKETLENKIQLGIKLLFLFMLVYIFSESFDHPWMKLPLLFVAIVITIFAVTKIHQTILWCLFLTILVVDLICNYTVKANHHFFLIYITILVILWLHNGEDGTFIMNVKFLIVIVLLVSAIQKLLSAPFILGDYYYYMFNTGNFFKSYLYLDSEIKDVITHNMVHIRQLEQADPNIPINIQLKNIHPNIYGINKIFAWFTIALESITALLVLVKPKMLITHVLMILLIVGICLTRLETGFLTLVAIGGLWLSNSFGIRVIYSTVAILFMACILTKIGYH